MKYQPQITADATDIERLFLAQQVAEIGSFDWDLTTGKIWLSPEERLLLGIDDMYLSGKIEDASVFTSIAHPEDGPRMKKYLQEAVKNHLDYDAEFRIITKDKTVKWLKGKGKFFYDESGKAIRLIGVNFDITARKMSENSLQFKAQATRLLSSSLQYEEILHIVCSLAVKYVADWCTVDVVQEYGTISLVAIEHKDPKKISWAKRIRKKNPISISSPTSTARVINTGKPEFYPEITEEMIQAANPTKDQLKILRKLGFSSMMVVPLEIRGKIVGAITFISAESGYHYQPYDFEIAQQLASRASLSLENSALYMEVTQGRERLRKLLSNVPCVVWERYGEPKDGLSPIGFISHYAEELLGYPIANWDTDPYFSHTIIHDDDRARVIQEYQDIYNSGKDGVVRFRWIAKDGRILFVETHCAVIPDAQGNPVGLRGVTMDISSRMELEQRKDDFIAMASHELKTPVTSLRVFTQVLQASLATNTLVKAPIYLERMGKQIDTLAELVSDLLDLSKVQSGKLALHKEEFSIRDLVAETIQTMQPTTKHAINLHKGQDLWVLADRNRIGQVIINLLSNAIKYSPGAKEIDVSVKKKDERVLVRVQDYGIGIPDASKSHIFERFYRVFDATDKTFPGLGIGLYITKEIIERHDGTITLESKLKEGTNFTFTLPIVEKTKG